VRQFLQVMACMFDKGGWPDRRARRRQNFTVNRAELYRQPRPAGPIRLSASCQASDIG